MADIKSLDKIGKKWTDVTPQRAAEYQEGIKSPKKSWSQGAENAADVYEEGVQTAITNKSFAKGVAAAGDEKWKDGALKKGVKRWPQGVKLGGDNYKKGFAPFHSRIQATTLPPRGPKGDPRNYDRVRAIGEALHEEKVGA